ncbi:VOC family protein [Streptomyces sp. 184]|uniref:VOC family protein n=1 Tax=Streptomyces sp. 184 TaxID=1827526 RepID=UPI0038916E3F
MTAFYHVCFVVPDIERAMLDLQRSARVEWSDPVSDRLGEWDYRIVFTAGGPPFIELIEGSSGSPWDASGGARDPSAIVANLVRTARDLTPL